MTGCASTSTKVTYVFQKRVYVIAQQYGGIYHMKQSGAENEMCHSAFDWGKLFLNIR